MAAGAFGSMFYRLQWSFSHPSLASSTAQGYDHMDMTIALPREVWLLWPRGETCRAWWGRDAAGTSPQPPVCTATGTWRAWGSGEVGILLSLCTASFPFLSRQAWLSLQPMWTKTPWCWRVSAEEHISPFFPIWEECSAPCLVFLPFWSCTRRQTLVINCLGWFLAAVACWSHGIKKRSEIHVLVLPYNSLYRARHGLSTTLVASSRRRAGSRSGTAAIFAKCWH